MKNHLAVFQNQKYYCINIQELCAFKSYFYRLFSKLWLSGQKSKDEKDWKLAEIQIKEAFEFQIIIRATRGEDFYSDIAIDDLLVKTKCSMFIYIIKNTF